MKARYVNPFTDFGFKKLFGEEASKQSLMDFLNSLLPDTETITSLSFQSPFQTRRNELDRNAIFDVYCENEKGEMFVVELQKAKQNYFKDRKGFFASFPILEKSKDLEWDSLWKKVYCIGILDFTFKDYDGGRVDKEVKHIVPLENRNEIGLCCPTVCIYVELPNFIKKEDELEYRFEKWLYILKNLEEFDSIPAILDESVFQDTFFQADLANFTPDQHLEYEGNLKVYRDLKNVIDYAYAQGLKKGLRESIESQMACKGMTKKDNDWEKEFQLELNKGYIRVAKKLKESGSPHSFISSVTNLSPSEISML